VGVEPERRESVDRSECDGDLAMMLCDQFAALGHRRPAVARVVEEGDVVLLVLAWWEEEGKEPLNAVAPTLGELISLDTRREIVDVRTAVTPDGCRAMVSFVLGASTEDKVERAVAVRNWVKQVQRHAIRQQEYCRRRRPELVRLQASIRLERAARHADHAARV
jgi:hypothetical protein